MNRKIADLMTREWHLSLVPRERGWRAFGKPGEGEL